MRLLFLCVFLFVSFSARAADDEFKELEWLDEPKKRTFEQKMLSAGDGIQRQVDRMADQIDRLLAGKKYTKMASRSNARLSQVLTHSEGGVLRTSTDFNLNLRFPNLEKRWQVRFTSYDEAEESRDLQQRRVRTRPRRREYGAAVGLFKKLGNVRTTFQPRLLLKNPLEMSYVLRLESSAALKTFRIVPRFELFADPIKGTGEFFSLEFVTRLSDRLEFSIQNEEEYRERGNFFFTNHGLSFDYALSDTQGTGLAFVWGSSNRPHFHLDTFTVATSYAQEIYFERLRYSLSPFLLFAKSDHFKGDVGITFNLVLTL